MNTLSEDKRLGVRREVGKLLGTRFIKEILASRVGYLTKSYR